MRRGFMNEESDIKDTETAHSFILILKFLLFPAYMTWWGLVMRNHTKIESYLKIASEI